MKIKIGEIYQVSLNLNNGCDFLHPLKRDSDGKEVIDQNRNLIQVRCEHGHIVIVIKKSPISNYSHLVYSMNNNEFFFINDNLLKKIE